jgi:hypothetical protein
MEKDQGVQRLMRKREKDKNTIWNFCGSMSVYTELLRNMVLMFCLYTQLLFSHLFTAQPLSFSFHVFLSFACMLYSFLFLHVTFILYSHMFNFLPLGFSFYLFNVLPVCFKTVYFYM